MATASKRLQWLASVHSDIIRSVPITYLLCTLSLPAPVSQCPRLHLSLSVYMPSLRVPLAGFWFVLFHRVTALATLLPFQSVRLVLVPRTASARFLLLCFTVLLSAPVLLCGDYCLFACSSQETGQRYILRCCSRRGPAVQVFRSYSCHSWPILHQT